jgi:ABC-type spermidine/putrescine transport system permease subunit II
VTAKRFFIFILLLFFVLPLAVLLVYSFAPVWNYPDVIPRKFSSGSYDYIFSQRSGILLSLGSSFSYAMATVLFTIIITILPAQVFARKKFRGRVLLETVLIAPALLPAMSYAMGAHYIFLRTGLSDSFVGLVLILSTVSYPYMLRALTAGFIAYGEEYALCSKNLGAGFFRTLFHVELPLLLPSIISGGTIVFLVSFSEYFLVFLIGGGVVPSYSGYLFPFLNSSELSIASLLTLIFMIVPFILFMTIEVFLGFYYRKRFIQV